VTAVSGTWLGVAGITGGTSGATGTGDQVGGPVLHFDDKDWLQSRGIKCLLILNNNLGTGEPDETIGSAVVNDPTTYVPLIVAACVANGWDGITCNLEAVPSADRAAATAFYQALAPELQGAGKLLHCTAPATTGTDYDADFWTGWCDHDAICRVVDAMKVLTYTETGPGTEPGSASPQWHFDATVAYLRERVYRPFQSRLLLGARCFGHVWNNTLDLNDVDYVTYADALATGMVAGVPIDFTDGEGTWVNGTIACWFGTPGTVTRSVQAASVNRFGGVGIWKADDGDIHEHWPVTRQIGERMPSFSEERFPDRWSWFAVGGPGYKVFTTAGDNDYESRLAVSQIGLRSYRISLGLNNRTNDVDAFLAFWQLRRGPFQGFRFKDHRDFRGIAQDLGTGTGAKLTFQLRKAYANSDAVTGASSSMYRLIAKPLPGSVVPYLDGVEVVSGFTVDTTTGIISFSSPPGAGVVVTADFEFDVPVRFTQDRPPLAFDSSVGWSSLSGLEVKEVRLP
jgi:uncharacterized protein (TIGR02217 family)